MNEIEEETIINALNEKMLDAFEGCIIKDYFKKLLLTIWEEGEGFSGKRPFGSSWEYDIYLPLARAGYIDAKFDEDGYLDKFDGKYAYKLVTEMIKYCFEK